MLIIYSKLFSYISFFYFKISQEEFDKRIELDGLDTDSESGEG